MTSNQKVGLIVWCSFLLFATIAIATQNLGPKAPIHNYQLKCIPDDQRN